MDHTINTFIKSLEQISPEKRDLPLVIQCPNGMLVSPNIKMIFKDDILFSKDSVVEKMIITWRG
jgi:hypothetical protein